MPSAGNQVKHMDVLRESILAMSSRKKGNMWKSLGCGIGWKPFCGFLVEDEGFNK